ATDSDFGLARIFRTLVGAVEDAVLVGVDVRGIAAADARRRLRGVLGTEVRWPRIAALPVTRGTRIGVRGSVGVCFERGLGLRLPVNGDSVGCILPEALLQIRLTARNDDQARHQREDFRRVEHQRSRAYHLVASTLARF